MFRRTFSLLACFFITIITFVACSDKKGSNDFQTNEASDFELMKVFEGHSSLEEMWNSIDPEEFNEKLKFAVNNNIDEFETFSYCVADLLEDSRNPVSSLVGIDLKNSVTWLTNTDIRYQPKNEIDSFYTKSGDTYAGNFYSFLDNMREGNDLAYSSKDIAGLIEKPLNYLLDTRTPVQINADMDTMIEDVRKEAFQKNFIDFSKFISRLLIQSDYSMWVDDNQIPLNYEEIDPDKHTSVKIGQAVKGTSSVTKWINRVMNNPDTRVSMRGLIREFVNIFDPDPKSDISKKWQALICNLEDHFTKGGEIYEADPAYHRNDDTIYSDAELGETIRELFPGIVQLFMRSDRPNALIVDKPWREKAYIMDLVGRNLRAIGFNPDFIDVERSLHDLMQYDVWGRDRNHDTDAWASSFLETLLFLGAVCVNHGWEDGGQTSEAQTPHFQIPAFDPDARVQHGHGKHTGDLTLNDALISIKTHRTFDILGLYEVGFKSADGHHNYRSRRPFVRGEIDQLHAGKVTDNDKDFRFFYNQNYGVLQFLAGSGSGDLGAPDGGNPDGISLGINKYLAYNPTGLHETQLAAWMMGLVVRACFSGEGPYYYADADAETVVVNGKPYHKYLRPNGRVYALVYGDPGEKQTFIYPTDEGDAEDENTEVILNYNEKRERYNRYKEEWNSDYYISHYTTLYGAHENFLTLDNSGGDLKIKRVKSNGASAGHLVYQELIAGNDPKRGCSSPEEAFYRNFQWITTEKKMVLVIPIFLRAAINGFEISDLGVVYLTFEANGISGLSNMRPFQNNHVWAKKGENGRSNIPGDYRVEVASHTKGLSPFSEVLINDASIYHDTLDCGHGTPSIIGKNLPAVYRMAFPTSPEMDRGNGKTDREVGSQDFQVGDALWEKRNALVPILFSIFSALREHTPDYNPNGTLPLSSGIRNFLDDILIPLIKPLGYYQKNKGTYPHNTWKPRVFGTKHYGNYKGNPYLQSSAEFYDDSSPLENWYGSWEERKHFKPAEKKTLINVLMDSDISHPDKRCDGILPVLLNTKFLTNLLTLLLDDSSEAFNIEDLLCTIKPTKGVMTAINEGAQYGKAGSYKNVVFPNWMFAVGVQTTTDDYDRYSEYENVRREDFVLDDLLSSIIGHDEIDSKNSGFGIAAFPDDKAYEEDWEDFSDTIEVLGDLLHEDSEYAVTTMLLNNMDKILARDPAYTSDEISGLLYSLGKFFAYYDGNNQRWIYQGYDKHRHGKEFNDLYNTLKLRLVVMHDILGDGSGINYYSTLMFLSNLFAENGLVEFMLNSVSTPYDTEEILYDVESFLESDVITDPNSRLWITLADLLNDLGKAADDAQDGVILDNVYKKYGFQMN